MLLNSNVRVVWAALSVLVATVLTSCSSTPQPLERDASSQGTHVCVSNSSSSDVTVVWQDGQESQVVRPGDVLCSTNSSSVSGKLTSDLSTSGGLLRSTNIWVFSALAMAPVAGIWDRSGEVNSGSCGSLEVGQTFSFVNEAMKVNVQRLNDMDSTKEIAFTVEDPTGASPVSDVSDCVPSGSWYNGPTLI